MKPLIVTSADARYAPLLDELIASIRQHPQFAAGGFSIGVIDAGLGSDTRVKLQESGVHVVDGIWPVKLSDRRIRGREYLKACVSRPFIPKLFPGFTHYIWLDADTWVQTWDAIDLLLAGADRSGLAIVPQVDRSYGRVVRLGWLGPLPWKPRSFYYSNAYKAFGGKIARQLFGMPILNAGVFTMRDDAPHWPAWQDLLCEALNRGGKIFTAEQLTLGMLVWLRGMKAELLPARCNWLCETTPEWDAKTGQYVEPFLPQTPIGILHLCGFDAMRVDKSVTIPVRTTCGETIQRSLRFGAGDQR